jgi:hypothetical protein
MQLGLVLSRAKGSREPVALSKLVEALRYDAALGDLITTFVQPRHTKLGLADNERTWLDQLRETLADVG